MTTHRHNPDSPAMQQASADNVRAVFAAMMQAREEQRQAECDHADTEGGQCIDCGKDCTDLLVERAEYAADSIADR